ncbi:chemotaxis protein CheA [Virgibacillus halodenitrificans]|uniref:chemotaxis protein CheA n=1 Tax=Virgibacillus halodenitrificans TaxID=1482 RepID=UPI00045C6AC8|nr:chemotaxis protein CheA [Virgibacillus halodenitrificans]MCG1026798.1 chemotaxis protein CheA [Virgibacillus halodenitrificans]MEC2160579.1 chemotaxis protein CheA [Virgibacillus halodenitrificans]CDQ30882.1 Chemotaxis protein CheA [Virgibacillus halodenitrificans]
METSQYIDMFLDESREHLQAVNDNLLHLEKQPDDLSIVNEIFRSAHTLKGMAATMGYEDISALTHKMENVLDKIRNSELMVNTHIIDIIFQAIEALEEMVEEIAQGNDGKKDVTGLVNSLDQIENGKANQDTSEKNEEVNSFDTEKVILDEYQSTVIAQAEEQGFKAYYIQVRLNEDCLLKAVRAYMVVEALESKGEIIKTTPETEALEAGDFSQDFTLIFLSIESTASLESVITSVSEIEQVNIQDLAAIMEKQAEESKHEEPATEESSGETAEVKTQGQATKSTTIRVNLERIDHLMNLFEEVVIDRSRLEDLAEKLGNPELAETVEHMSRVSEDMQSLILTMRMVAVEQVFNRFPRMVRGLAKDLNKKIDLQIIGADTELDRTVIDEIGDPLVHLIRNSIDHGIELPAERLKAGKQEEGELILRAYHSGNHVFIEIQDDGAGINREKVEEKAVENGLITKEAAKQLTDEEIYPFILASGFSTAATVSDISGRGVGLDVVKSKIEALGGKITIESEKGKGSKFSIQLPLTLSILSSLLVKVEEETYAIPLSSIIETALLKEEQIMSAHGKKVMDFRGSVVPLVSLKKVFDVPESTTSENGSSHHAVVIVKKGEKMTGLMVDSFIGQREIVLKSLGNYLKDVFAISGSTILGDGQVALIIDPNALIK